MRITKICSICNINKTLNKSSWYANNECAACRAKIRYSQSNRNEYKNKWRQDNKDHCKIWRDNYLSIKKKDPIFRLKKNMRNRLNQAIKNNQKKGSVIDDLGCSIEYFKEIITKRFYPCPNSNKIMTWDNYGEWHIDHIKALANFDLTNKKEFKKAVHYTNLQPLWAKDNFYKGIKDDT